MVILIILQFEGEKGRKAISGKGNSLFLPPVVVQARSAQETERSRIRLQSRDKRSRPCQVATKI